MPIFAPILRGTPPVPVGFNYHEVVTNWANGGTLFRNRLDETYDAAGVPIPDEICRVLEGIAPGSYVAIDIEELGYNDHPTPGNNRNQIDYVIAAKACRPDLFIGYFSAFIQSANELVHPANGPNRQAYEDNFVNNGGMDDLAAVVDFLHCATNVCCLPRSNQRRKPRASKWDVAVLGGVLACEFVVWVCRVEGPLRLENGDTQDAVSEHAAFSVRRTLHTNQ